MKRSWNPSQWKKSTRLLLGLATIWPHIYLFLFIVVISISLVASMPKQTHGYCGTINLFELEEKIRKGEIEEIAIRPLDIKAKNRAGTCAFYTPNKDDDSRIRVIRLAHELDAEGKPHVAKVGKEEKVGTEETRELSRGAISGFIGVFIVHMLTIIWVFVLVVIYALLAAKNEQLDQTMKIVWVLLICLLTMFTMPVYWYLYVWRPTKSTPGSGSTREPG